MAEKKEHIDQKSALASVIRSHRTFLGKAASWFFGKRTNTDKKVIVYLPKQQDTKKLILPSLLTNVDFPHSGIELETFTKNKK
jgi:hypothetical protein